MIDLAIDSRVFIYSPLDEALQELDMLFNTENTELLGYPEYGTNFEQFLWQLNPTQNQLKEYILKKMQDSFFLSSVKKEINVQILKGEYRNIYQVQINLYLDGKYGFRTYQLR